MLGGWCAKAIRVSHRSQRVDPFGLRWQSHKCHVSHGGAMRQVGCVTRSEEFKSQTALPYNRRAKVQTELVGPQNTPRVGVNHLLSGWCAKAIRVSHRSQRVDPLGPRWRSHKCHVSHGGAMRQVGCVTRSEEFRSQTALPYNRRAVVQTKLIRPQNTPRV